MATLVGTQRDPICLMAALIALDYDAIAAYRVAIDRLDHTECREHFKRFCEDHERHVKELSGLMQNMQAEPPEGADITHFLTAGRVLLSDIVGGDRAILEAMLSSEEDTNAAYAQAAKHCDLPGVVRLTIERNLADERTHRAWIEQRVAAMEALAGGDDVSVDACISVDARL